MCIKSESKELLSKILEISGKSAAEIARTMGISSARISTWKVGKTGIPSRLLKSLQRASGVKKEVFWSLVSDIMG